MTNTNRAVVAIGLAGAKVLNKLNSKTKILITDNKNDLGADNFENVFYSDNDNLEIKIKDWEKLYNEFIIVAGIASEFAQAIVKILNQEMKNKHCYILVYPFDFEGERRKGIAESVLSELKSANPIVIYADKILANIDKKITLKDAFDIVDAKIIDYIKDIN